MEYKQLNLDIGIFNIDDALTDRQTDRPHTLSEKINQSKQALILAADMSIKYYGKPLIITYSGGKDSDVMLNIAESCLNPNQFEVLNSHTTVDAPETVYHIRNVFKRLNQKGIKTTIDYHKQADGTNITMWSLIVKKKIPPTRIARYCCQVLKETGTPNRLCALGVREAESTIRQNRDIFATRGEKTKHAHYFSLDHVSEVHKEAQEIKDDTWDCTFIKQMKQNKDTIVNPIYNWGDLDIWDYISQENIDINPLYKKGYERVGCIGCPLAPYHQKMKQFADYPQYKQLYINAFERMLKAREKSNLKAIWKDGKEVFNWWVEEYKKNTKGQMNINDFI